MKRTPEFVLPPNPTPEGAPAPGTEVTVSGRMAEVEGVAFWLDPIRKAIVDHYDTKGNAVVRTIPYSGYRAARVVDLHPPGTRIRIRAPHDSKEETVASKTKKAKAPRRPAGAKETKEKVAERKALTGAGRATPKGDRVVFLVGPGKDGAVTVAIEGREKETTEILAAAALKDSVMKAAYAYTDKHLGTRDKVGNKGGSLYNRIRAVLGLWTPPARKAS